MQKKNKPNLIKKIICAFLLSLTFITSGSIVAYAVGSVEAGVYRLNALSESQYTELISSYSFTNVYFNVNDTFNFYDVNSNLIVSNTEYNSEACLSGFGKDSTNGNLSSYFIWQDLQEVSWHYFAGNKTNSSLTVINNWYYIELLEDVTTFSTTILDKFFIGSSVTPFLVKTELGSYLPGDTPTEYEIPAGTYKFNFNFYWPLLTEAEFTGNFTFLGGVWEYSSLRVSSDSIIAYYINGTESDTKVLYENGVWVVDDPTFTTTGLNPDSTHNATSSFLSQVNGDGSGDTGLVLQDKVYKFKSVLTYPTSLNKSNISFKTGEDNNLTFTKIKYLTGDLTYGNSIGDDIVYSNNTWVDDNYKNFYMPGIVESYRLGSFLATNLDISNREENYFIKGYYYFNDSILVNELLDLTFLTDFSYIHKGTIYNSFLPDYNVVTNNGVVTKYVISLSYYNTNTKNSELLLSGSYTSHSEYINTNDSSRQIYISPSLVNYDTYTWLNENGLWIYYNDSDNTDFGDLMLVFPDVVIHFLASVLSFDLFGIDVFTAICSILTVVLAVWLIRKLL